MTALAAVVITAAMIRRVAGARTYSRWFVCELCGEGAAYVVESGEHLCGACLLDRRRAWRDQIRPRTAKAARAEVRKAHEEQRELDRLRRDFEGDLDALDLARDGYFDEYYQEWSGSETVGPKPRWVVEPVVRSEVLAVSPHSFWRAIVALSVAVYFPLLRANALFNAALQLSEAWYVADGHRDLVTMYDGTDDPHMGDDMLAWLHRDPSSRAILNRWNRPDDELAFMEEIRETGRESEWWELMVDFRRRKLDALLKEYFGLDDYRASMIVLKWEKGSSGRWRPAKQMNVVDWVKWSCEQSGSTLGGLQSCTRSIQVKTQLRNRKEAKKLAQAGR